jgi:hypothetical protein
LSDFLAWFVKFQPKARTKKKKTNKQKCVGRNRFGLSGSVSNLRL